MKRVLKSPEPPCLQRYRSAKPSDTWEGMRNDSEHFGQAVYDCIAELTLNDQGGLCAYCEIDISRQLNTLRIDHFVARALSDEQRNWGLEWSNMLACCKGGENKHTRAVNHFEQPIRANLSCDAHVNRLVQKGGARFPLDDRRGVVLNPLTTGTLPTLFRFDADLGKLHPHPQRCAALSIEHSAHSTTFEIVDNTIRAYNLNCPRLCRARKEWFEELEQRLEEEIASGRAPEEVRMDLCLKLLKPPYPSFFTVSRLWLGEIAEAFLGVNS